ncbi:DUF4123 domain-containing protein [Roseinatronobacter monicus]|nr:DUF4123 domain-containing protein [Roseinatronobacter monicus]
MSVFLGFCHVSGGDAPSQLIAAAFCADRPEFEALVGAALAAQGYRLDWAEDVLPAGPWVGRHPSAGGAALARLVHEGRHVALGPMTPLGGVNAPQDEDQDWLHVEEIGPITPLDAQFGVHPKKSVPDALHDALFGQPEPSEAERAAVGDALPPLATYAVLDAAKMPYLLTSLLESSGLRYQSLFQGAAQEDLGEHAPYLVELKDGHDFTRRLFTGPNGIGGLWGKELGIFLRSRAGFDALRKHLRKFTRVQDEEGKWYYFRYWEGDRTCSLCMRLDHPTASTMLCLNGLPLRVIVAPSHQGACVFWLKLLAEPRPFRLPSDLLQDLRQQQGESFLRETLDWMKSHYTPLPPDDDVMASFRRALAPLSSVAIRSAYATRYALAGLALLEAHGKPLDAAMRKTLEQKDRDDARRAEEFLTMVQQHVRPGI